MIRRTEEVIAKLQQMKQGLLHDLLTRGIDDNGELRDPDRHPEHFKDSELGRIPKEWEVKTPAELCSEIVDCPHSTPVYEDSGVPCIRTADMIPGVLLAEGARRVSERSYTERVRRLEPEAGDIIYSREGERLGIASPVGTRRICLGQRVMHLRPSRQTDAVFLLWVMNSPGFYRQATNMVGATTSPHINIRDIRTFLVPSPAFVEQQRFAEVLAASDVRAKSEQSNLSKLRLLKSGLMDDLLTGRVRVTDLLKSANP